MNATSLRALCTSAVRRSATATADKHESSSFWKKVFIFAAIPAIGLAHVNAFLLPSEHEHRPEFKPYPYLRIRKKPFPWGDGNHSLFHSHNNALPEGYEDEH